MIALSKQQVRDIQGTLVYLLLSNDDTDTTPRLGHFLARSRRHRLAAQPFKFHLSLLSLYAAMQLRATPVHLPHLRASIDAIADGHDAIHRFRFRRADLALMLPLL